MPEKGMIPDLGCIVEDTALRGADQLLERYVCLRLTLCQSIQGVDVRLMVFAIVKFKGFG